VASSADTTATLIRALVEWIDRLFPDPARAERLRSALVDRFGDDPRPVTGEICAGVEAVCQEVSRHLELHYDAEGALTPDTEPPGWPSTDAAEVHARAACVRDVSRRADGVGVLALDGLDDLALAAPYLEAAFALLRSARGVVIDLRENGGGDPGTVALVLDWLLGPVPTHLSDVIYHDRMRQWWTAGRPAERALPPATPVAVVIGAGTYSSGEALAYHFQSQGRGQVVGQMSRGAADHVTPVCVTSHVSAILPEGYYLDAVTGANWEGVGVKPDVTVGDGDALEVAVNIAKKSAAERSSGR
jgi:C-terminal processing protease CtpA/Prc